MARKLGGTPPVIPGGNRAGLGVVVVEPLHVVRAGLALLVGSQPDLELLDDPSSPEEAMSTIRRLKRREGVLVLVSLALSGERDAYWLIRSIRERCPAYAIVAWGASPERSRVSRALFVGADGFVDAGVDPGAFLDALRRAAAGEIVLTGMPRDFLSPIVRGLEGEQDGAATLTAREREILTVAAEGLTARQIATRLGLRERTVTTHLGNIYGKLGVGSRVEAIGAAARQGLVTVGWAS